jgi:plasmid stabilization system protein ParE
MEVKLFWTNFAKGELNSIYKYHRKKASLKIAKKIINGIYDETQKLRFQPKIGQVEPLIVSQNKDIRYLVYSHYKIIYWIKNKSQIVILDVFDTRQNPVKTNRSKDS